MHSSTRNRRGDRVGAELHITVDVGNSGLTAHIPCFGLDLDAENYYTSMTHGSPKWSDRATSSNGSSAGSTTSSPGSASGQK